MPNINEYPDYPKFNIHAVSKKTDILTVTLRAWERRYQVVTPQRGENGYRLYSERDIAILNWLKNQVESGVPISAAAAELKSNVSKGTWPEVTETALPATMIYTSNFPPKKISEQFYDALVAHNEEKAAAIFGEAHASFSLEQLLQDVISPTLVRIGEAWYEGRIKVATEHFASVFIRYRLMSIFQAMPMRKTSPKILVGGSPGELHEIGPIMVALLLRQSGYLVEYLGPDIPLDDLLDYAESEQPRMIILSATMRESAEDLGQFNAKLARLKKTPIFGYGGAAFSFSPDLVAKTPGVYLGKTLQQSIDTVRSLIKLRREITTLN